jgi:transcriptional regulator with XRE-family HTH domain
MNGEDLREMRLSFEWSQERLAEALEVDVSTISRWERNKTKPALASGPRIGRLLKHVAARTGTRALVYGNAMIPESLLTEVKYSPTFRALLYGKTGIFLQASDYYRKRSMLPSIIVGFPLLDLMTSPGRDYYLQHVDMMFDIGNRNPHTLFRIVTNSTLKWLGGHEEYREYVIKFPMRNVMDQTFRPIPRAEYEARRGKYEIIEA